MRLTYVLLPTSRDRRGTALYGQRGGHRVAEGPAGTLFATQRRLGPGTKSRWSCVLAVSRSSPSLGTVLLQIVLLVVVTTCLFERRLDRASYFLEYMKR
jgi:hypothetical protein